MMEVPNLSMPVEMRGGGFPSLFLVGGGVLGVGSRLVDGSAASPRSAFLECGDTISKVMVVLKFTRMSISRSSLESESTTHERKGKNFSRASNK